MTRPAHRSGVRNTILAAEVFSARAAADPESAAAPSRTWRRLTAVTQEQLVRHRPDSAHGSRHVASKRDLPALGHPACKRNRSQTSPDPNPRCIQVRCAPEGAANIASHRTVRPVLEARRRVGHPLRRRPVPRVHARLGVRMVPATTYDDHRQDRADLGVRSVHIDAPWQTWFWRGKRRFDGAEPPRGRLQPHVGSTVSVSRSHRRACLCGPPPRR